MEKMFRGISVITAVVGFSSMVASWIAGRDGYYLGFDYYRLTIDATNLLLTSVAFGVLSGGAKQKH